MFDDCQYGYSEMSFYQIPLPFNFCFFILLISLMGTQRRRKQFNSQITSIVQMKFSYNLRMLFVVFFAFVLHLKAKSKKSVYLLLFHSISHEINATLFWNWTFDNLIKPQWWVFQLIACLGNSKSKCIELPFSVFVFFRSKWCIARLWSKYNFFDRFSCNI